MKIISKLGETIIIIVSLSCGVFVWDSVAFGVYLAMIGIFVKIITTCATMTVDLMILIAKNLYSMREAIEKDCQNLEQEGEEWER